MEFGEEEAQTDSLREPCYGINGWSAAESPSFIREESKSKSCKCPYKTIEKVCPIKEGNPFRGHIAIDIGKFFKQWFLAHLVNCDSIVSFCCAQREWNTISVKLSKIQMVHRVTSKKVNKFSAFCILHSSRNLPCIFVFHYTVLSPKLYFTFISTYIARGCIIELQV